MSLILHTIRQEEEHLHGKERELADYIMNHPDDIVHMSITELAELSGTSTATVTRFCKSLHFSGYPDFKMKLSADLAHRSSAEAYQDIEQGKPLVEIVQSLETNSIKSISDTTRLLQIDQVAKAVDALLQARAIDLYGAATSGLIAQDFHQKLLRIGKLATAFADSHLQITSASGLQPGDVAFAISYSGETEETLDALRCAKEQGATTISLTKYGTSRLASLADVALFTSPLEEGMRRGDMASRIAQLHVVDVLFTAMLSARFADYVPKLEQSYQMVRKYRKSKGRNPQ